MPSFVNITPALGASALYTQTGPSAGYSAWDDRRNNHPFSSSEGVLTAGAYRVSQRAAGANLSVDVAANVGASSGASAIILGDSIANQGYYVIPPAATVVNLDIAGANPTNPRNDLVVIRVSDDSHDANGLNGGRVEVITGTATAGAAMTDAYGVNGTPALPSSCLPLAVVNVPATDTTIADAQINDRRSYAGLATAAGDFGSVKIAELAPTAGVITFSSIPQTFRSLKITGTLRIDGTSATAAEIAKLRFNADATAIYSTRRMIADAAATIGKSEEASQTQGSLSLVHNELTGAIANSVTHIEIIVPNYTAAAWKGWLVQSTYMESSSAAPIAVSGGGVWRSTAAVTSVSIFPPTLSFDAISRLTLYGLS